MKGLRLTCRRSGAYAICDGLPKRKAHHSPTGYEWGYGGSGPADLALNVLAAVLPRRDPGDRDRVRLHDRTFVSQRVWNLHQLFKWQVIARMPRQGFTLTGADVERWLAAVEESLDDAASDDVGRLVADREEMHGLAGLIVAGAR